jgi:integrase
MWAPIGPITRFDVGCAGAQRRLSSEPAFDVGVDLAQPPSKQAQLRRHAGQSGVDVSEILSIRREDIDLQRRVVFIPKAKAGAREQPITEHLGEFLASYAAALQPGNPWLFPSPGAKAGHTVDVRSKRLGAAS